MKMNKNVSYKLDRLNQIINGLQGVERRVDALRAELRRDLPLNVRI